VEILGVLEIGSGRKLSPRFNTNSDCFCNKNKPDSVKKLEIYLIQNGDYIDQKLNLNFIGFFAVFLYCKLFYSKGLT
jgi:hypothetical protein